MDTKLNSLPSRHQIGDEVEFTLQQKFSSDELPAHHSTFKAVIKAVHFYLSKIKYDLEIPTLFDEPPTRIYNVDSCYVEPSQE